MIKLYVLTVFIILAMLICISNGNAQENGLLGVASIKSIPHKILPKGIEISIDTFPISIKGELEKVVLLKDKFYCMFESDRQNTTRSFKKMIALNRDGEFIEDVFVPKKIQELSYYNLIVENDSLFLKQYQFNEKTFLLDKYEADLKPIDKRNFSIYEDDIFKVFSACYGEWGGTIFFQNIQTNEVYEAQVQCPIIVNKVKNSYYVTNYVGHMSGFASILKIPNPADLHKSNLNFSANQGSQFNDGIITLFNKSNFYIPTSFAVNGQLRHLYSDENGTYIGKIENNKMIPIYKFDFKFYAHFNQQDRTGKQVLGFNIPESEYKGILIIVDGRLNFHFIK